MKTVESLKGKRVLIFQQRGWGLRLGHFLGKRLQDEGCLLAALTFKKSTHHFTKSQKEVSYELVINDDEVAEDPLAYLDGEDITFEEICRELGISTVWPFIVSLRQYVRDYGARYYYGYGQKISDEEIEQYVAAVYKYIRTFFEKFKPDIIIAPAFGQLVHVLFYYYAKKQGVPMMSITDTKIRNLWTFSYDYLQRTGPLYDRIDELNEADIISPNRQEAKKYIAEFRQSFKDPDYMDRIYERPSLIKRIKSNIKPYYQILVFYRQRHKRFFIKKLGINTDNRPPRIILRDFYTKKRNTKFANSFEYYPISKLDKFVYQPLQTEPETTIDLLAPYFNNQLEVARQAALALPDDYTLVVKDHPVMLGRRSPGYLKKLSRLPNVKVIDYRVPSEQVLSKAALVISPSSTSIAEAAFYNTPGIQLGDLGTSQKLPNVIRHTDMTTLSKKIRELLATDFRTDEYERRLENYVAAVFDTSFKIDYAGVWHHKKQTDMDAFWQTFKGGMLRALKDVEK